MRRLLKKATIQFKWNPTEGYRNALEIQVGDQVRSQTATRLPDFATRPLSGASLDYPNSPSRASGSAKPSQKVKKPWASFAAFHETARDLNPKRKRGVFASFLAYASG
jgi:hypothetical protein